MNRRETRSFEKTSNTTECAATSKRVLRTSPAATAAADPPDDPPGTR